LKAEFVAWLKALNAYGKDVILVAHMDEQRIGDDIIERLDVQGGSKGEIYKAADAMGRVSIKDGKRVLNFNPTEAAFGKNPGRLDVLPIPHPDKDPEFMADVIATIKTRLNELTAEQAAAQKVIADWRQSIDAMQGAADFNIAAKHIGGQPVAVRELFKAAAKAQGLTWDKATNGYVDPVAA
jgi:hypothetical protein